LVYSQAEAPALLGIGYLTILSRFRRRGGGSKAGLFIVGHGAIRLVVIRRTSHNAGGSVSKKPQEYGKVLKISQKYGKKPSKEQGTTT